MTDLANQRRMAAEILGVGVYRVWIDPAASEDIAAAITREDVRGLIGNGAIKRKQAKGVSRGRARARDVKKAMGHRRGCGSRKGSQYAKVSSKERWMKRIRAQRKRLRDLRGVGTLNASEYRKLYCKAKGGEFRDVAHLDSYIESLGYDFKEGVKGE